MEPTTAHEWLDVVLDDGWTPLFEDVVGGDPLAFPGYAEQLAQARAKTGCSESVLVALGTVDGLPVVAVSFEFGFLGGSMGVAAGERICRAFERAADERIPVIALTASGGARMQEGMHALAQMPATVAARARLAEVAQPFIAYLRHPTTGGVFASFASTADVVWAQPDATIGFAGPRVAESVTGHPLPEGSHTATAAAEAGLIDAIVDPGALRTRLIALLRLLDGRDIGSPPPDGVGFEPDRASHDPWERVERARDPARPSGGAFARAAEPLMRGGVDATVVTGLMKIGPFTTVVIAQDRHAGTGRTHPAGYRRAREAIATAARLGLPIVTFVDTPGADPSAGSEREGVAREIARTFDALLRAPVPTVACVVGEGGSGGALALAACDRLVILRNAIFSVIAPEGAASILRRDDVPTVARELKLTADDLHRLGLADRVIDEPASFADGDAAVVAHVAREITAALQEVATEGAPTARRTTRWRVLR